MTSALFSIEIQSVLGTLLPFLLMIGLGIFYRLRPAPGFSAESLRKHIAAVALHILFPCMAFRIMAQAPWDWDLLRIPLTSLGGTMGGLLLFWLLQRGIQAVRGSSLTPKTWAALALASAWGNFTYLGIPLIQARYPDSPEQGIRVALLFDLFSGTPSLFFWSAVFGALLLASPEAGLPRKRSVLREAALSLVRMRPLWAAILGLMTGELLRLTSLQIPTPVDSTLKLAGTALPPLMIFAIGLALPRPRWSHIPKVIPSVLIKLAALPLIAFQVGSALNMDSTVLKMSVFESALPTMALTLALSDRYGFDTEALAQSIFLSTLLLPISLSLLGGFGLI